MSQVKTFLHSLLVAYKESGAAFVPFAKSTLNELMSIEHGTSLPAGVYPDVKYMVFGRGGEVNALDADGNSIQHDQKHKVNSCRLNDMLPLLARPIADDLTDRSKYRLRRVEQHDGDVYAVYYAYVIDISAAAPKVDLLKTVSGVTTPTAYTALDSQLEVDPVSLVDGTPTTVTGEMLSVYLPFSVNLTTTFITEALAATKIVRGAANLAVINEAALVSGIDQVVSTNAGGVSASYTEVLAAQITNHLEMFLKLYSSSTSSTIDLKLSDTQPLLP